MSRRDPSHFLVKLIQENKLSPEDLSLHERKLIVQFLRLESNMTFNKIAEFLKMSVRQIKYYAAEMRHQAMRVYPMFQTEKYARHMAGEMEELKERARAKNDNWLELAIIDRRTKLLGRMGMIEFKAEPPAVGAAGDLVMGNKIEVNQQQIARQAVLQLTDDQRLKLRHALEDTGLVSKDDTDDE